VIKYIGDFTSSDCKINSDVVIEEFAKLPLIENLYHNTDFSEYDFILQKFANFKHIIHLGTGGSSLGIQALCHALRSSKVRFDFFDNIDPILFVEKLSNVDLSNTGVLVVSKSGNTAETLVQLATIASFFKNQNLDLNHHMAIICQTDANALHEFANAKGLPVVPHNPNIGGRYAVFAEVGILPGLIAGFDMYSFKKGAKNLWEEFKATAKTHPIYTTALHLAATKLHPVNFIYSERLRVYGAWFAQLWAESLGKTNAAGECFGTIPMQAMGAVDQHSQLQLYLGGPKDKFFTFLECLDNSVLPVEDLPIAHEAYLGVRGKNLKELYVAEFMATYQTIKDSGITARCIALNEVNTYNMGQLMMGAILETLLVAKIWRVNPFDQPAVESGKKLALHYLNAGNAKV
jgi:glucose-6-phosphate isomerase